MHSTMFILRRVLKLELECEILVIVDACTYIHEIVNDWKKSCGQRINRKILVTRPPHQRWEKGKFYNQF